jgi:hypothetical protein
MEPPSDLVIIGTMKYEVRLSVDLSEMAQLVGPICLVEPVLRLHSESIWTYSELAHARGAKSMHPMTTSVRGPDSESVRLSTL